MMKSYQDAASSGVNEDHFQFLEVFDNQYAGREFVHTIINPEWSSMCPKTGHPDYATVEVSYVAGPRCIELKAFKLYCQSYRTTGIFYENLTNKILDDLVEACQPIWMRVVVRMTPRGGIRSVLTAEFPSSGYNTDENRIPVWRQMADAALK
jgi:7-cyano-7-deazaguanine reductase